MHFYSYRREDVLALPIKFFWLLNQNVERILAQSDMRNLRIGSVSQSTEDVKSHMQSLQTEVGNIVKRRTFTPMDEQPDFEGIAELKAMRFRTHEEK